MKPYLLHLKSAKSLETPYEAVRAGFVALALEKNRRATPFVAEARALKVAASRAKTARELLNIEKIRSALITASGVSDKAAKHLTEQHKTEAIQGLIGKFLEPAGSSFVEELVFRFLLTRGDTLGGSMRNVGGFIAQTKLSRAIIACLRLEQLDCQWLRANSGEWHSLSDAEVDVESVLQGISWIRDGSSRTLLFNVTIPFNNCNVDLCLLNGPPIVNRKDLVDPVKYIALGELKGGIDPAGADEHWKTARSALTRIRDEFKKNTCDPALCYIGAAIEVKMATEIWTMLKKGILHNAANLTDDDQLMSISQWLCSL